MLRVLTLSTLFPNAHRPTQGVFVERQTRALADRPGVAVEVVAPVGLPPFPLVHHPHYRPLAKLPAHEQWHGLAVHRPRFRVWPGLSPHRAAERLAAGLLPYLRALRRRFPFDVLDTEFFWPDGPAAMRLADALGVPFSIKARGADVQYWPHQKAIGPQIAAAGRAADGLLAVSHGLKRDMVALGLPEDRIRVHYTGIDLERFRPLDRAAAKAALGVSGPLLVTAGALIPRKGQAIALEALALIPEATLILVGHGPDRAALEAKAAALGLAPRVHFAGPQPHEALPRYLAAADVMLLPTASEGLANVWMESFACGTPVVTTDVGGAREVITSPAAGRLVAREPAALAAAARELLAAPPAAAAVRRHAEPFSWARNGTELEAHLRSLIAGQRSAA